MQKYWFDCIFLDHAWSSVNQYSLLFLPQSSQKQISSSVKYVVASYPLDSYLVLVGHM